jgi:hypothetical protein
MLRESTHRMDRSGSSKQKPEVRSQKSEVRSQKSDIRDQQGEAR